MLNSRRILQAAVCGAWLAVCLAGAPSAAVAQQDFALTASKPNPPSVEPSLSSISTITVQPLNGFTGSVALTCAVTPVQTTSPPGCLVSPGAVVNSGSATLTFTTASATPPTLYTVTITGTGPSTNHQVQVNITVLAVTAEYTLTVTTPVTPTSVHAGSGATGVLTITPVNGYSGSVTPSCATITPIVTPSPVCSFSPATVPVTPAQVSTTTLTISTSGPPPTGALWRVRPFYALWLAVPGLALMGLRARSAGRAGLGFVLIVMLAAILLTPGCGSNNNSSTSSGGNTPKNAYSISLTAADANALAPSNGNQTVTLTVN